MAAQCSKLAPRPPSVGQVTLNQKVGRILSHDHPVVMDCDAVLLLGLQPRLAQLMRQRVFVYLLQKPASELIADGEGASNYFLRQFVHLLLIRSVFICVHLWFPFLSFRLSHNSNVTLDKAW